MNENLNLIEILKDCPKGTKLYSMIHGDVEFVSVSQLLEYPIEVKLSDNSFDSFTNDGRINVEYSGECLLFPSKDQRDWSKFKVKKPKFDPKTLKPFDKVLTRDRFDEEWYCNLFSHCRDTISEYKYAQTDCCSYVYCIPYNDDTKHLVGTIDDAPEFYRYWED